MPGLPGLRLLLDPASGRLFYTNDPNYPTAPLPPEDTTPFPFPLDDDNNDDRDPYDVFGPSLPPTPPPRPQAPPPSIHITPASPQATTAHRPSTNQIHGTRLAVPPKETPEQREQRKRQAWLRWTAAEGERRKAQLQIFPLQDDQLQDQDEEPWRPSATRFWASAPVPPEFGIAEEWDLSVLDGFCEGRDGEEVPPPPPPQAPPPQQMDSSMAVDPTLQHRAAVPQSNGTPIASQPPSNSHPPPPPLATLPPAPQPPSPPPPPRSFHGHATPSGILEYQRRVLQARLQAASSSSSSGGGARLPRIPHPSHLNTIRQNRQTRLNYNRNQHSRQNRQSHGNHGNHGNNGNNGNNNNGNNPYSPNAVGGVRLHPGPGPSPRYEMTQSWTAQRFLERQLPAQMAPAATAPSIFRPTSPLYSPPPFQPSLNPFSSPGPNLTPAPPRAKRRRRAQQVQVQALMERACRERRREEQRRRRSRRVEEDAFMDTLFDFEGAVQGLCRGGEGDGGEGERVGGGEGDKEGD